MHRAQIGWYLKLKEENTSAPRSLLPREGQPCPAPGAATTTAVVENWKWLLWAEASQPLLFRPPSLLQGFPTLLLRCSLIRFSIISVRQETAKHKNLQQEGRSSPRSSPVCYQMQRRCGRAAAAARERCRAQSRPRARHRLLREPGCPSLSAAGAFSRHRAQRNLPIRQQNRKFWEVLSVNWE